MRAHPILASRSGDYFVGRITAIAGAVATEAHNPYALREGTVYHEVDAEPDDP